MTEGQSHEADSPARRPSSVAARVRRAVRWLWDAVRRADFVVLVVLALIAAAGLIFVEVADTVIEGEAHPLDTRLFLMFREPGDVSDPRGGRIVEEAVRDLTALGGSLMTTLATLFVTGFLLLDRRPRAALFLAASTLSGVGATFLLKSGFDRPRPDLVPDVAESLTASFPSGHTATAAVVYLTLGALLARALPRRRLKLYILAFAVVVTLGVGVSRVYLGVHWPSDVLAGWTFGAAWALGAWLLERYLRHRGWL